MRPAFGPRPAASTCQFRFPVRIEPKRTVAVPWVSKSGAVKPPEIALVPAGQYAITDPVVPGVIVASTGTAVRPPQASPAQAALQARAAMVKKLRRMRVE